MHKNSDLADHAIVGLVPSDALRRARELADQFRAEEAFRNYVVKHFLLVLPVVFGIFIVSTLGSIGLFKVLGGISASLPGWLNIMFLLCLPVIWCTWILSQIYVMLVWLRKKSLGEVRRDFRHVSSDADPVLNTPARAWNESRPLLESVKWLLWIGVLLVAPLALSTIVFPYLLLVFVAVGLVAVILLTMLDA